MKTLLAVFVILFLAASCQKEEQPGTCSAYNDSTGKYTGICIGLTRKQCDDYNQEKKDGYNWKFSDGDVGCAPIPQR